MKIEKLEWDSNFFKKRIGKLILEPNQLKELDDLKIFDEFDIVYIFSQFELPWKFHPIDIKLTYSKVIQNVNSFGEIIEFDESIHCYEELLELVYLSGHESRFLRDSSFGLAQFKRLYKKWINNSIADNNIQVLINMIGGNISGFVTLKKEPKSAQIGLIAVSSKHQGMGVGKKLIKTVESSLKPKINLIVQTQENNLRACEFYKRMGFQIIKKEYIYHYANNTI